MSLLSESAKSAAARHWQTVSKDGELSLDDTLLRSAAVPRKRRYVLSTQIEVDEAVLAKAPAFKVQMECLQQEQEEASCTADARKNCDVERPLTLIVPARFPAECVMLLVTGTLPWTHQNVKFAYLHLYFELLLWLGDAQAFGRFADLVLKRSVLLEIFGHQDAARVDWQAICDALAQPGFGALYDKYVLPRRTSEYSAGDNVGLLRNCLLSTCFGEMTRGKLAGDEQCMDLFFAFCELPCYKSTIVNFANAGMAVPECTLPHYLLTYELYTRWLCEFDSEACASCLDSHLLVPCGMDAATSERALRQTFPPGCDAAWSALADVGDSLLFAGSRVLKALGVYKEQSPSEQPKGDLNVFFVGKRSDRWQALKKFVSWCMKYVAPRRVYALWNPKLIYFFKRPGRNSNGSSNATLQLYIEDWPVHLDLVLSSDLLSAFALMHRIDSSLHRFCWSPKHGFRGTRDALYCFREKRVIYNHFMLRHTWSHAYRLREIQPRPFAYSVQEAIAQGYAFYHFQLDYSSKPVRPQLLAFEADQEQDECCTRLLELRLESQELYPQSVFSADANCLRLRVFAEKFALHPAPPNISKLERDPLLFRETKGFKCVLIDERNQEAVFEQLLE